MICEPDGAPEPLGFGKQGETGNNAMKRERGGDLVPAPFFSDIRDLR